MKLRVNRRDYSKYEPGRDSITVTLSEYAAATPITVRLVREDGYGDVIRTTITPAGATHTLLLSLNTSPDVIATGDRWAVDDNGINWIRQGRYHVEATILSETVKSPPLTIDVIPVDIFKQSYLFGVSLYAEDVFVVVEQPKALTGVTVGYIDNGLYKGVWTLVYTVAGAAKSLALQNEYGIGTAVPITAGDELQTARLLSFEQDGYIEIEVDPLLLPGATASETILIDNWRLRDTDLRRYLWDAYKWVEGQLQIKLETCRFTSLPVEGEYYDEIVPSRHVGRGEISSVAIPSQHAMPLRLVESLTGHLSREPGLTIPAQWIRIHEKSAHIDLVPVETAVLLSAPTASMITTGGLLSQQRRIPNFWHYTGVSGLRNLDQARANIREAIQKKAALELLTDLSVGAGGGRSSASVQRDGISDSRSYGQNGVYSEKTQGYAAWLDANIPILKNQHRGFIGEIL